MMTNIKKLKEWYLLSRRREFLETHDKEEAWNQIQYKIQRRHKILMLRRWGSVAAISLVVCGAAIWWNADKGMESTVALVDENITQRVSKYAINETQNDDTHQLAVPMGAEYTKKLDDGTKIILNAGAIITYSNDFNEAKREVGLKGEAYFEVAHNDKKPFVVTTPSGVIEVLGTHFNVIAENDQTIVTLSEGSVRLSFADREFTMKPGEQACMMKDGSFYVYQVNADNYTSWSTGTYEFTDVPLEEITRQLSLWYDVKVKITDEDLRDMRFTGVLMRNESLENAIHTLEVISGINMKLKGNTLEVTE